MKKKFFISALLCLILMTVMLPVSAAAAATAAGDSLDGLTLSVNTDKDDYTSDETAAVTVEVANTNSYGIFIVNRELLLPDEMSILSAEGAETATVNSGETVLFPYTVKLAADGDSNQHPVIGDYTNVMSWIILVLFLMAVLVLLGKNFSFRALSILLCLALQLPLFSEIPEFETEGAKTISVTKTITVDGVPKDITATVTYTSNADPVTVFFETNGGSEVLPITINRGETLSSLPMPSKDDYAFTGWYTDSALDSPFYSDVPVVNNQTLYAQYAQRDYNFKEYTQPNQYIEDCPANFAVAVLSPVALTSANLQNYIEITSYSPDDVPALTVTGGSGKYTISPLSPELYTQGCLYTLALKNDNIFFDEKDEGVRRLSFRIHKDETKIVQFKEGIIDVFWADVTQLGEEAYTVPAAKYGHIKTAFDAIAARNANKSEPDAPDESVVLCFQNGSFEDDSLTYRKAIAVTLIEGGGEQGDSLLLNTADCLPGEIYEEIDIYGENLMSPGAVLEELLKLNTEQIAEQAKNGEGAVQMAAILDKALSKSRTVQNMLAKTDDTAAAAKSYAAPQLSANSDTRYFEKPGEGDTKVPIPFTFIDVEGLDVTCTIGGTDNANFRIAKTFISEEEWAQDYPHLADEYPNIWPVLTLKFEYSATIKNKVQVDAVVEIKEFLTVTMQGGAVYDGKFIYPSTWDDLWFDAALNLYSQTDISLSVLVKSVDETEGQYEIDVTKEIENLLNDDETDDSDPASILEKVLGDKGDYIDIIELNLFKTEVQIIPEVPVIEIEIKLDFVVRVNFAAGISSKMSYLCAQQLGVTGNIDKGELSSYKHALEQNGLFEFDLYAAGYFGVKAGLRGSVEISIIGLDWLAKLGASVEIGAYLDIYGFAHLNIYRHSPGCFIDGQYITSTRISLQGGLYMEMGIYVEIQLFAESDIFNAKATFSLLDYKLPIFTLGEKYVLLEFINKNDRVLMTADTLPLLGNGSLLEAKYVDMTTGKKVEGTYAKLERFEFQFSSPDFEVVGKNIVLKREDSEPKTRADTGITFFYKGGTLTFGNPTWSVDLGGYQENKSVVSKDLVLRIKTTLFLIKNTETFEQRKEQLKAWYLSDEGIANLRASGLLKDYDSMPVHNGVSGMDKYREDINRYFDDEDALREDYNDNNLTKTQAKLIWLVWLDPSIAAEIDAFTPVNATYVLSVGGAETVLEENRELLPGYVPGAPNIAPSSWWWYQWIQNEYDVVISENDNFNAPITKDTVYRIYASKAQKLVSFITYTGVKWRFDVYAVNAGETPAPPAGYNSASLKTFTGWVGEPGLDYSFSPSVYELKPVFWEALRVSEPHVYTGLDTTLPLYSVCGTLQDCYDAYYSKNNEGECYAAASQYLYTAQYAKEYCTVRLEYPTLTYYGVSHSYTPVNLQFEIGEPIIIPLWYLRDYTSGACELMGIDSNDDGTADFNWENPPVATGDMTLKVLLKVKTLTVTVLDHLGNTSETLAVDIGGLPDILNTSPPHPDASIFKYWAVSKSGGDFRRWSKYAEPGVYENWTIQPVYEHEVRFQYTIGNTPATRIMYLPPGTYKISDFALQTPYKNSDEKYDYTFAGWDCGDAFTVTGGGLTINEAYTTAPTAYTVTFNTAHGELSTGGKTYSIASTYFGYEGDAAPYLAANAAFADVTETDRIWKFEEWGSPVVNTSNHTVTYQAVWSYTYRDYTITYDAGEAATFGALYGGGRYYTVTFSYPDMAGILDFDSIANAEDDYNTYTIIGWRDENNDVYLPKNEEGYVNTVQGNKTFTAVYTAEPKVYTVTVTAGGGKFADGTFADKVYTGGYGQQTNIGELGTPTKESTAQYVYTFYGWSSAIPATFTQNITITAGFTQSNRMYSITFYANGGTFSGGGATYTKDFAYGSTINPAEIPQPTKSDDAYVSYTFDGWERYGALQPVTQNCSYYAAWVKTIKDAPLPAGIFISDGVTTEDINCVNIEGYMPIGGYEYELAEYCDYDPETGTSTSCHIPTLTVIGDGLTVSGAVQGGVNSIDDMVALTIADSVTDIGFENLSLTGLLDHADVIYVGEGECSLTVTVSGDCRLEKYSSIKSGYYRYAFRSYRNVLFSGSGAGAALEITAENAYGIMVYGDMTFANLRLTMDISGVIAENDEFGDGTSIAPVMAGAFNNNGISAIHFIDSDVSVRSPDSRINGSVVITGGGYFEYLSTGNNPALMIGGSLVFEDFTGTFHASFEEPDVTEPAVIAAKGIEFTVDGLSAEPEDYGVRVGLCHNENYFGDYYSFVDDSGAELSCVTADFTDYNSF